MPQWFKHGLGVRIDKNSFKDKQIKTYCIGKKDKMFIF